MTGSPQTIPLTGCDNRRLRILHAIHDFLPRHQAGSEIYAAELCRALTPLCDVTILCAEFDHARGHGEVAWRVHDGLAVVEVVNNWRVDSFSDTYRSPRITRQLSHVLDAVQPHLLHVHSLLNLSFDLTTLARARGIPIVATLHDYTLVCPSGGQRIHRSDEHICATIDFERCARCFRESSSYRLSTLGRIAAASPAPGAIARVAHRVMRSAPALARRAEGFVDHFAAIPVGRDDIEARMAAARRVFDEIDLFVAPSPSIAREFGAIGLPAAKLQVSDYGFAPLPQRRTSDRRPRLRIGFVGTLVWHKGAHVLIDAVGRLPSSEYELNIFGDDDVFPEYAADLRARAAGLPVVFKGRFDRHSVGDVFTQIDLLVVPSLWLENSPLVIHEAFMAGVPVVAARIGGIPDLVDDGRNGLLYDPRSSRELTRTLAALLADRARLEALAAHASPVKTIAQDAASWMRIYEGLLNARRPAPPS